MGQEQYPISKQSNFWKSFERFGVIIALIASLATVTGLLLQVRSEKRAIELQIISADQLTRLPSVNGLDGKFSYNDIPVTDLWRLRIKFLNSGDVTLIGEGAASSLMKNSIQISFPSNVNILDASSESGSFYNLTQPSATMINIEFSQWRPGESFETIIYLASNSVLDSPPMPTVKGRPIINGNIETADLTAKNAIQPKPAIDYAPSALVLVGKILGGTLALSIGLFSFGWLVIASTFSYLRAQYWKFKYGDAFRKHLDKIKLPEKSKKELLKTPWLPRYDLPPDLFIEEESRSKRKERRTDESDILIRAKHRLYTDGRIWKGFDGPRPPEPSFETFRGTIIALMIGIALMVACSAIMASMIIV